MRTGEHARHFGIGLLRRERAPQREGLLQGRVAIITGATGDIGSSIAEVFANEGAHIVLNGRSVSENALNLQTKIARKSPQSFFYAADVADEEQANALAQETWAAFGRVDILVNNAGIIGNGGGILNTSLDDWNEVIRTNQTGTFVMTKAVVPYMIRQGSGRIINISSMAGVVGLPMNPAYSSSKAGVDGLMKSNAGELGKYGIVVNDVAPSFVKGRMARRIPIWYRLMMKYASPIHEVLEPKQVANTVLMYASDLSSGTTGQVHILDNGLFRA